MIPSSPLIWIKLIGGLAIAAALAMLIIDRNHQRGLALARGEKLEAACGAIRAAAGNPKMRCADLLIQIGNLGDDLKVAKAGIANQNSAIEASARRQAGQQKIAAEAENRAAGRAASAQAASDHLEASARASKASGAPCEPSQTLRAAWQ